MNEDGPVAQMDRAFVSQTKGRVFDSRRGHQIFYIAGFRRFNSEHEIC